jgi:hypothetical protein
MGLYKTTDGGYSWLKVAEYRVDYGGKGGVVLSPHYLYDHTVIRGGESGFYLSHDGGLAWQQIEEGPLYLYGMGIREQGPFGIPAVTPSPPPGPHFLYFPLLGRQSGALEFWIVYSNKQFGGNCYLYRSRDEGVTWQAVSVFEAAHWQYLPWASRGKAP